MDSVKDAPDEASLIAGEIIQNLRSALDHLAYQLFLRAGGTGAGEGTRGVASTQKIPLKNPAISSKMRAAFDNTFLLRYYVQQDFARSLLTPKRTKMSGQRPS